MYFPFSIYISGITLGVSAIATIIVLAKKDDICAEIRGQHYMTAISTLLLTLVVSSQDSIARSYDFLLSKAINGFIKESIMSGLRKNISGAAADYLEFYFQSIVKRYCQIAPIVLFGAIPFLVKIAAGHNPGLIAIICTLPLVIASLDLAHKAIYNSFTSIKDLPSWVPSVISEALVSAIAIVVVAVPFLLATKPEMSNKDVVNTLKKMPIIALGFISFGALHGLFCGGGINSFDTSTYQGAFLDSIVTFGLLVGIAALSNLIWAALSDPSERGVIPLLSA